jgi:hypothetical protein
MTASDCLIRLRPRGRNGRCGSPRGWPWPLAGDMAVIMMTEGRGCSNAKAKRELGWTLRYRSWRQGFTEELA